VDAACTLQEKFDPITADFIRSDNARLEVELRAGQPPQTQLGHVPGCRSDSEESE
jgi:hypothetical protein